MVNESENMHTNKIIEAMKSLTDAQLLSVLEAVFSSRRPFPLEEAFNQSRYFLGISCRELIADPGQPEVRRPSEIAAVAYIDRGHYPDGQGPDWGFCQSGECSICGVKVCSNVKNGICPACASEVYLT